DDADVVGYLRTFTFRDPDQVAELEQQVRERPAAREAQRALAHDVTVLVHGAQAAEQVVAASKALFGRGDLSTLDRDTLGAAVAELPGTHLEPTELDGAVGVVDLLVRTGLVVGRGAARRAI